MATMSTKTFDFQILNESQQARELAQKAWDAGNLITVMASLPELYRNDVERWLIQNGVVYNRLEMLG